MYWGEITPVTHLFSAHLVRGYPNIAPFISRSFVGPPCRGHDENSAKNAQQQVAG